MILKRRLAFLSRSRDAVEQFDNIILDIQKWTRDTGDRRVSIPIATYDVDMLRHLIIMLDEEGLLKASNYWAEIDRVMRLKLFSTFQEYNHSLQILELKLNW